jgi:peptidyl-prolyl cis-trans isomerase D
LISVAKWYQSNKLGVRIILGVIVGMLGIGMLLYLVPGQAGTELSDADTVAQVGSATITLTDLRTQMNRLTHGSNVPPEMVPQLEQETLKQLIYTHSLDVEAERLGIRVTDEERRDRILLLLPDAFQGDTFEGMDRYSAEVQERFQMQVPEFEELIRQSLLEEKFQQLVTDGIGVTPDEEQESFRFKNEKIKISYVILKPEDLASKVDASDADLAAYFEKNKAKYIVPEKRVVQYARLDFAALRQRVQVSEDDERADYNTHIDLYRVEDRVHVAHILFKTVGKTDAEVEEIRKTAEGVLQKAKHGGDFAALAKQYSDDTSKDNGGDIGWITRGQTVPEFEQAAFTLQPGSISDLVKTQYGFHIIHVLERQVARTKTFDEVRPEIQAGLQEQGAEQLADNISNRIAEDIRRTGSGSLQDLAAKYGMTVQQSQPLAQGDVIPDLGPSPDIQDQVFRLRAGDVSSPIRLQTGYVILSVKEIQPAHPGTLAEVRDSVLSDFRQEKSVELAQERAQEIARRVKAGEKFDAVAKSLDLQSKDSVAFSRGDSVPDVGPASKLEAAFSAPVGQTGDPIFLGANWVVYQVSEHDNPDPADFDKQKQAIEQDLLQSKRQAAYEAFRDSLQKQLENEGKVKIFPEAMKRLNPRS